ncbi:MAG: KOW domain-containing RNA-binding protein [Oscillospiraceae bacterium]|nr:KOW domain-containing RNA-binding protein [Oscillospiraceae bacterium]
MEIGRVVWSKSGHDKHSFYMVVGTDGARVYIADGKRRKLIKPKAKNPIHLSATRTLFEPETVKTDKRLRDLLKQFGGPGTQTKGGDERCPKRM